MFASPSPPELLYDKGERRFKHVGRGPSPYIEFDERQPRKWVGKCPDNIPDAVKRELLKRAIPGANGDTEVGYIRRRYVVHEGAIYEARTSDGGTSYHAYPYKGRLAKGLLEALRAMANAEGTLSAFEDWVENYVETGGKD